jgi:hypothetical protein
MELLDLFRRWAMSTADCGAIVLRFIRQLAGATECRFQLTA